VSAQPVPVSPIPRTSLASMITERPRESIINRTLSPGSRLSESELAGSFGVSRAPFHEAFQRLIQEGLLRNGRGRRAVIPVLSDDEVRDIYLARDALESSAVQHIISASQSARAADELDRTIKLMQDAETVGDWEAVSRYHLEFHTALVAATGSTRLQRMFSTVISETRLCLGVLTAAEARANLVDEHRQIAAMIREGNTAGALGLLNKHFEDAIVMIASRNNRTVEDRK
jgi:DNA-binding GntR family transcriptional regulator